MVLGWLPRTLIRLLTTFRPISFRENRVIACNGTLLIDCLTTNVAVVLLVDRQLFICRMIVCNSSFIGRFETLLTADMWSQGCIGCMGGVMNVACFMRLANLLAIVMFVIRMTLLSD